MQKSYYFVMKDSVGLEVRRLESDLLPTLLYQLATGQELEIPSIHEFPDRVREAAESLSSNGGWALIPDETSESLLLSAADQEFLANLRAPNPPEEVSSTLYDQVMARLKEYVPLHLLDESEVRRILLLVIGDFATRLVIATTDPETFAHSATPREEESKSEPESVPETALYRPEVLGYTLRIGRQLEAQFAKDWKSLGSFNFTLARCDWEFASESNGFDFLPEPSDNEVWLSRDGLVQSGLAIDLENCTEHSLRIALHGLFLNRLASDWGPKQSAHFVAEAEKSQADSFAWAYEVGWSPLRLHFLLKAVLGQGLNVSLSHLQELFSKLCQLDPEMPVTELAVWAEKTQFSLNCLFGHGGHQLEVLKLSKDSQAQLRQATTAQGLFQLQGLKERRYEHRKVLLVPQDLALKSRIVFGQIMLCSELGVPPELEVKVVGEI